MSCIRRVVLVPFLLVLAAATLPACSGAEGQENAQGERADQEEATPSVEAVQAQYGTLPLRERVTGTVRATGQVAIYPERSGLVVEVLAENGERVARGASLVRLNPQTTTAQLEQARATLDVARAEAQQARANLDELMAQFSRTQVLAEDSLVSGEIFETQQAQVEAARASYAQAQAQVEQARATVKEREEALAQTVVRAPISGHVGQRNAEVGMRVDGQTRLFTIGSLETVRVEIPVTQEMIGHLRVGQTVTLTAESLPDTTITAEVSRISPFLEEGSFSAEAEIDVANEEGLLRPGMFVAVDVFYGESQAATLVPTSALYEHPDTGDEGVYVAPTLGSEIQVSAPSEEEGTAPLTPATPVAFRSVEVLAEGDMVVGLQGVDPGTWVVVVGQHLLSGRGGEGAAQARVRPSNWTRITELQRLQRQDLLRQFMEKQQRIARQQMDSTSTTDSVEASMGG